MDELYVTLARQHFSTGSMALDNATHEGECMQTVDGIV